MMKTVKRSEMNPEYMWDLTAIYPSDAHWQSALAEAEGMIDALSDIPGTLGACIESMKHGLDRIYAAEEAVERVYCYAFLKKSGDGGDPVNQAMAAQAMSLVVKMQTMTAFVNPEVLAIKAETLGEWMASDALSGYCHILEDIARLRPHTLDAGRERLMAMMGDAAQTPKNAFEMLCDVDMRFEAVRDEAGREVPLTHGSFGVFRESRDARVRREAFEHYFGEYSKYINTLTALYGGRVKLDCFSANARGYESACERALYGDNVPVSLYDALIEVIHEALPTMRDYIELRRRCLGAETVNLYDLYAPIVEDAETDMPYESAKAIVKAALRPLGEEYQGLLDRAFSEKWIDVYENQGKHAGAFSLGVYGAHPYVLMNYTGKLDNAFTLAHELGHSMHSFFSDRAQDYANHDYALFVAEVASTVNEVLLTRYLLSVEKDKKRRAVLLHHFLEDFRTTVFRQTLFAEFERRAHDMFAAGQPLTAEALNGLYHELNALYYNGCEINALCDVEWARIPHFYRSFYVYKYATGFSSAVTIADNILRTGDASDYLKFLSTGGSDYPINELQIAGVDLTKPDALRHAMRVFGDTLNELKALLEG